MPRKYAVLKQFAQDLDRLLTEAEAGFAALRKEASPTQAQILVVYRPVHSLKGICGMVEETKLLVRAFHALEEALPPLLPVRAVKMRGKNGENAEEKIQWSALAQGTFQMAREVEQILLAKLELWKKLGADENESRGLIVAFTNAGVPVRVWVGITALVGLVDAAEIGGGAAVGAPGSSDEALLIESSEGPVALYFDAIETTCTRLEALQAGVPTAFKEWWTAALKRRDSSAA